MDSTLNTTLDIALSAEATSRLAAVRDVRSWRAGQWLPARVATLLVPIVAFLAWCFLALNPAQARVQIDFDPMRPPAAAEAPAGAAASASSAAPADVPVAAQALPTLRITRQIGSASNNVSNSNSNSGPALAALVDDTWVRRGDVVAGYRVIALRTESIDLVSVAEPGLRLTLRLNPVSVDRSDVSTPVAAQRRIEAAPPSPPWPPLALEKK